MTAVSSFHIRAVRGPSEVVLEAPTATWRQLRSAVEAEAPEFKQLRIALEDGGVHHSTETPLLHTLVVVATSGDLEHTVSGNELLVAGSRNALRTLFENIDCSHPFEGAHHHSGPYLPWVEPSSIEVVFTHKALDRAL
jgi:hypothetical protein